MNWKNTMAMLIAMLLSVGTAEVGRATEFAGSVGRQWVESDSGDATNQTAFELDISQTLAEEGQLWGPLSGELELLLRGLGFEEEDSVPFMFDVTVVPWLSYNINEHFVASYSPKQHNSNGEPGETSKSVNAQAAKLDVWYEWGDFAFESRFVVANISDLDENGSMGYYTDMRAIGDTEWMLSGWNRASWVGGIWAEHVWAEHYNALRVGGNPTDGDNTIFPTFVLGDMKGQVLGLEDQQDRFVAFEVSIR